MAAGLVHLSLLLQQITQVVVSVCVIGVDIERSAKGLHRCGQVVKAHAGNAIGVESFVITGVQPRRPGKVFCGVCGLVLPSENQAEVIANDRRGPQ